MWPWVIAGALLLLWMSRGHSVNLGVDRMPQLPGAAGIVQTMGVMRSWVNQAIDHPLIRRYAAQATEHVPRGDQRQAALAIGEWVRAHVRYLPDPLHQENLTHPGNDKPTSVIQAIHAGKKVFGDCDDMAMLTAAMAKSIGMQPIFHGVGRGKIFHHVYTEVAGVAVDPTVSLGTRPFPASRRISVKV
jgi:hypothetical protein